MNKNLKVGVIGCGYWGINLVRNFYNLGVLGVVSDLNKEAEKKVKKISKTIKFKLNYRELMKDNSLKAIVIATPAKSHFNLVEMALNHNKHVFVEKPLCLNLKEGKKLKNLSIKKNLKLMVGHLMLYHPGFIKMKKVIAEGLIGDIRYIYSNRLNLGKLRKDEDVLWSFAPHDISMILNLVESKITKIDAFGGSYVKKNIKDTSLTSLTFQNNIKAHIFVSWLHPYKDQRLVVVGAKGMIVFADVLEKNNKLLFYNHKVTWRDSFPIVTKAKGKKILFNFKKEPLKIECKSFVNWILKNEKPVSDVDEGIKVLEVLNKAKFKLAKC
ncbi:MAG: oxidoreductase [Phycisphaerae bacterium]|nr:oxidoreductase [Phycisphaerae bacterium]|tara:strand:- start:1128 stop:2105 length:978 start_codon:yes stop_codon:yes gene_type:complete